MIESYLSDKEFTTREELVARTGYSDRKVRQLISELKLLKPVIYNSQTKGYRLAKKPTEMTIDEVIEEMNLAQHCVNDIESRKEVFNQQERVYIAYIKNLENAVMRGQIK